MIGRFKIPFLIIIGILLLVGASYFGFGYYKNYQIQKSEKEKSAQKQGLEFEELKQEIEALKNRKPEVIEKTIIKEIPSVSQKKEVDLSSIIKQWRPRVAYIVCEWKYSDTGEIYAAGSGSGFLLEYNRDGTTIALMTNKHVLENNGYVAADCFVSMPDMNGSVQVGKNSLMESASGLDWGLIILNPNNHIKSLDVPAGGTWASTCKSPASVGDEIVILGYPGIGSQSDITATEGIISGRDGDYYITSAKIDQGNSGGAAIHSKNNCYLGIPSFAQIGKVESLGRILDIGAVYERGSKN